MTTPSKHQSAIFLLWGFFGSCSGEPTGEGAGNMPITTVVPGNSAAASSLGVTPQGPHPAGACSTDVILTEATNYSFWNSLDVEMTTLKDATDLTFDWSELTVDFFGKPINPATDVKLVMLSLWGMTPDVLLENLARDNLPRSDNKGAITTYPDGTYTSMNLLGFDIMGDPLPEADLWRVFDTGQPDYQFPRESNTFLAMVSESTQLGRGARMLSMFNIDPASAQTELKITNDSTKLEYEAQLQQAVPVAVPAGNPVISIDWSQMQTNAFGRDYEPTQITQAVVAHYSAISLVDLEDRFLELEDLADGWWSADIRIGTSVDLSTLTETSTGAAFPGIDANGVWLVALFCTKNCDNPAPWSIAVLQPCDN